jgi:hypothetical protein
MKHLFSLILLLVGLSVSATSPEPNPNPEPKPTAQNAFRLDHYMVYVVKAQPINVTIRLWGQFDASWRSAYVDRYTRHLNPVEKNGEAINDKDAHLSWYDIQGQNEPIRSVWLENQFGPQDIKIGEAVALLVPTEKIEPGSQFPADLDHYKVYKVISGNPVNKGVELGDQFMQQGNVAMQPLYFAVPVRKYHNGNLFPINNPDDHLIFYQLDPIDFNFYRETKDQFGHKETSTLFTELLGVPSKKLMWQ